MDTGVPHTTIVATVSLKSLKNRMTSMLSVALDLHIFSFPGQDFMQASSYHNVAVRENHGPISAASNQNFDIVKRYGC